MHALNDKQKTEKGKFSNKARRAIRDMGEKWSPTERKKCVRSLVDDYTTVSDADADEFIRDNPDLIQNGQ